MPTLPVPVQALNTPAPHQAPPAWQVGGIKAQGSGREDCGGGAATFGRKELGRGGEVNEKVQAREGGRRAG